MRRKILLSVSVSLVALIALGWPSAASAQRRGGGTRVVVARGFYGPFYSPFYSPFYDPWFGPGWGWGWGGYPYGGWRVSPPEASLRLDVTPRDAQVYVDGYYAGDVDQFDGAFQRLRVAPGQHEIVVYKEGYKSIRERLYLPATSSRKISRDLDRLAPGEAADPPPTPAGREGRSGDPAEVAPAPDASTARPPRPGTPRRSSRAADDTGTVAIRVQPSDARIVIDGETWLGSGDDDERLIVQLTEGRHRVAVERDGYRPVAVDVDVHRGETAPVNISLSRE